MGGWMGVRTGQVARTTLCCNCMHLLGQLGRAVLSCRAPAELPLSGAQYRDASRHRSLAGAGLQSLLRQDGADAHGCQPLGLHHARQLGASR